MLAKFIEEYKLNHPTDKIIICDLYEGQGVPPLNDVTMEAWRKQKFNEKMTTEETALLKRHNKKALHFKNNSGSALMDLGSLYLTNMLKFYGIQDIESIYRSFTYFVSFGNKK